MRKPEWLESEDETNESETSELSSTMDELESTTESPAWISSESEQRTQQVCFEFDLCCRSSVSSPIRAQAPHGIEALQAIQLQRVRSGLWWELNRLEGVIA